MTTSTDALRATIELEDGHVRITCDVGDIAITVRDEVHAASVFLTADQAAAIAQVLPRASIRVTRPGLGAALETGDVQGAARVFLAELEGRSLSDA